MRRISSFLLATVFSLPLAAMAQTGEFWSVTTIHEVDVDNDGYNEFWSFEVDIDVDDGSSTISTSITITDSSGTTYGPFGPFSFTGFLASDNAIIGPFAGDILGFAGTGSFQNFTFTHSQNTADTLDILVLVEEPAAGLTYIASIDITGVDDYDADGYYERWSFVVDVDVTGSATDTTSIAITDSEGNDWGSYGPYTFTGTATGDAVTIGPITGVGVSPAGTPANVDFYFLLSESSWEDTVEIPLEDTSNVGITYIYSVDVTATVDDDADSYFESWSFSIDVDVTPSTATQSTSIAIIDDEGNDYGSFGPYTFVGTAFDAVTIGPFTSAFVNPATTPSNVVFTFILSQSNDSSTTTVPVDDPVYTTSLFSVGTTNLVDSDGDGYYESWDFEIDADVNDGGTQTTNIAIADDQGTDYGSFGPFSFTGFLTSDNAFIPFTSSMAGLLTAGNVSFTFTLSQSGDVLSGVSVAVDSSEFLQDSLALVAIYNALDGPNWTTKSGWLTGPLSTWFRVGVTDDRVTSLNLIANNLSGTIPAEIGNLTSLQTLLLYSNQLSGSIPAEIGNLTSLTALELSNNQLTGAIPAEIGSLTSLTSLELNNNQLSGAIPTQIGSLGSLTWLELNNNQLSGAIPTQIGNLTSLNMLSLNNNQLTGAIPTQIGNLTSLQYLYLYYNQLSGSIPTEIGDLGSLQYLVLNNNQLTGALPTQIGSLTSLKWLILSSNQLTGVLPTQIGSLTSLNMLNLSNNQLTGAVPTQISSLTGLSSLRLNSNQLTGLPDLSALAILSSLWIQNNQLTFEDIEPNIGGATSFTYSPQDSVGSEIDTTVIVGSSLDLSVSVGGTANVYQWVKDGGNVAGATSDPYTLSNIQLADSGNYILRITNTLATALTLYSRPTNVSVEYTPLQLDSLALVALYNSTNGSSWTSSWDLNTSVSSWNGVTVSAGRVTVLSLTNNNLSGSIPAEIGSLTSLTSLNLYNNQLSGSIPAEIGLLTALTNLRLYNNQLTSVPVELGDLTALTHLDLSLNQLAGSIPAAIGDLTALNTLYLQNNQFTTVPTWIGTLTGLTYLRLDNNQFTTLPAEIGTLTSLTLLALQNNQFTSLPAEMGTLTALTTLSLDNNQLATLPAELGNLTAMNLLTMNNNRITDLPDFSAMTSLAILYVQNNALTFDDIEPNIGLPSSTFLYAPQDSVGAALDTTLSRDADLTLTVPVGGTYNVYQWTHDGVDIAGGTSDTYTITGAQQADTGAYVLEITNTSATDLTLYSWPIHVTVIDTTAPATPQNLVAVAGNGQVTLTWDQNTEADFLRYRIHGGTAPNPTTLVDSTAGISATTKIIGNLANGTTYYYRVTALDSSLNESGFSNEEIATPEDITPPAAPQNLIAQAGNGQVTLTWDQNTEADFLRYRIHGGTAPNPTTPVDSTAGISATTKIIGNLANGTTYYYRVTALDSSLNESGFSNEESITPSLYSFETDSLALVALYSSTNGANWTTIWDLNTPVNTWDGVTVSGGRVTWLTLDNNNLSGTIPAEIGNLTSLTRLYLFQNQLTGAIPSELGNLASLQYIYFSYNQLSGSIPVELGALTSLTQLYLQANQLSGAIPPELGNLTNLQILHLYNNQLSGSIPTELGSLPSLTQLYLYTNQLTGPIPTQLGSLPSLTDLRLGGNQLTGTIPTELGSLTGLQFLYLYDNQLTGAVPTQIGALTSLTRLYLYGNQLTGLPTLTALTSLSILGIENNQFTFEDIEPNLEVAATFTYSPQDSVGSEIDTIAYTGTSLSLSVTVGGAANVYQWVKDGVDIAGATSDPYTVSNIQIADGGDYNLRTTNILATDLTLYSWPIHVTVIDTTAPATPQNLMAVAGNGQVTLTWDQNTEADFLRYRIHGGSAPNPTTLVDSTAGISATTKIIGNLANGTTYYYRVTALDSSLNESGFSNEEIATPEDITPPAAPQNLAAQVGDGQVTLTWNQNTESDFLQYRVYGSSSANPTMVVDSTGSLLDTTVAISGLINGTTYYYRITAVDESGNESSFSNEVSATPEDTTAPAVPDLLSVWPGLGQVTVTWAPNTEGDFLRYRIYGGTTEDPTTVVDSVESILDTVRVISGLTNGVLYYVHMTAVDTSGNESIYWVEYSVTPGDYVLPAAPVLLTAEPGNGQVTLSWSASSEADFLRYRIYSGTSANPTTILDSVNTITDTVRAISGLTDGTIYYFRMTAVDTNGNASPFSNELSATPGDFTAPSAPQILAAVPGDGQVILTWSASSEADFLRYRIYGGTTANPTTMLDSTAVIDDTTKTIGNLTNGTTYYYRVTAVDSTLNESAYSNEVAAMPYIDVTPPAVPQNLVAIAGDGQVTLNWTANTEEDFLHYRIYGGTAANPAAVVDSVTEISTTSLTITGLANGTTYYYRLAAVDLSGNESSFSTDVQATPQSLAVLIEQDSLALVAIYNSTGGATWTTSTNWLSPDSAFSTWRGVTVTNSRVTNLNLYNNNLSGILPASIGNLTALTYLDIGFSGFTGPIPPEIGALSNLTRLGLSSCQLDSIPDEIGNLTSLTSLDLQYNNLTGPFPSWIVNLTSLVSLRVDENKLTGPIPTQFANLTKLMQLWLQGNQLTDLPDLSALTALQYMYVQNNLLTFEDLEPNLNVASTIFIYSPQDSVGSEIDKIAIVGASLNLSVAVGGSANQYQWVKDGADIAGATDDTLAITSIDLTDNGAYILRTTNTIVTGLTLTSRPIHVTVIDTTAPVAPQNLVAVAGDSEIMLTWSPSTASDFLRYWIYGGTSGNETQFVDSVTAVNDTTYLVTGLTNDVWYAYQVTVLNQQLYESGYSNLVWATPVRAASFVDIGGNLVGISPSDLEWGDFDNDGDLDFVVMGYIQPYPTPYTEVYRNDAGHFLQQFANLPHLGNGSLAWLDYDTDGDLDILLMGTPASGTFSSIFRNDNGIFSDAFVTLPLISAQSIDLGDYDNDGDIDILVSGFGLGGARTVILASDGAGAFIETDIGLPGLLTGTAIFGDYDGDDDLDIFLMGRMNDVNGQIVRVTRVYRNDGGAFTDIQAGFPAMEGGSAAWGSFRNDGFLDLLVTGTTDGVTPLTAVYKFTISFDDVHHFTDLNLALPNVSQGDATWGDYDNDGDLDILLMGNTAITEIGTITRVYENLGDGTVAMLDTDLPGTFASKGAWGDYDGDGDLDFLVIGGATNLITSIYQNTLDVPNEPPAAPAAISSTDFLDQPNSVLLLWQPAVDDNTISQALTYNLRVGTTSDAFDVLAPHSDLSSGRRLVAAMGNAELYNSARLMYLPKGTYYWSVQAIDGAYLGSAWAPEDSFTVSTDLAIARLGGTPVAFKLHPAYPNPFNPRTTIEFDLPIATELNLVIYDLHGRVIKALASGFYSPGYHQTRWSGRDIQGRMVSSGIYIARIVTSEYTKSIKMVLLK